MNLKLSRSASTVLIGVISMAGINSALAAEAPPQKSATAKPTTSKPAATPAVSEKLSLLDLNKELNTLDEYSAMLQKAGYTTQMTAESSKKQALSVSWEDKTGKYGVNLTHSKQGETESLNFVASLSSFADRPRVPAEVFFKLVEAQDATRGWYFVFNRKLQRLFLCRTLSDTKVTSRQLLFELGNLESAARLTSRVWNPAQWITAPKPAPKAPKAAPAKAEPAKK